MDKQKILNNIHIILVEPEHPGNIGSVARAMNNMGIENLILISPVAFSKETEWLAHASTHILKNALIIDHIDELKGKIDILYATSNRKRIRKPAVPIKNMGASIIEKAQKNQIGILFGRENKGLFNEEIDLAEDVIFIPSFRVYPSLNLAQAVMITCYEVFMASQENIPYAKRDFASFEEKESLVKHFYNTLATIEYKPKNHLQSWKRMSNIFRDFLNVTKIDKKHSRFFHKYFAEVENFVKFRSTRNRIQNDK